MKQEQFCLIEIVIVSLKKYCFIEIGQNEIIQWCAVTLNIIFSNFSKPLQNMSKFAQNIFPVFAR